LITLTQSATSEVAHAGLLQQLLRLVRVVDEVLRRGLRRRELRVDERRSRRAGALQPDVDHLLLVDGVVQRLAHEVLVERRVRGVEEQEEVVAAVGELDRAAGLAELVGVGGRDVLGDLRVRLGAGDRGDARGGVHDGLPQHLVVGRRTGAVVVGELLEAGVAQRGLLDDLVRAGADDLAALGVVPLAVVDVLRHDLAALDPLQRVGERELEDELDRAVAGLADFGQPVREEAVDQYVLLLVEGAGVGEDDVVGGHRPAVVPFGAVSQLELQAGAADVGRQRLRQAGEGGAGDRVTLHEGLVAVQDRGHRERGRGLQRVPRLVVAVADDGGQRARRATGLVGGRRPAARGEHGRERQSRPGEGGVAQQLAAAERRALGHRCLLRASNGRTWDVL
jgi:hypothetical protein